MESLGRRINPWDYDVLLYVLGNSTFHLDTYAAARRYPGVTWLHDVNLVGLHLERAAELAFEDQTLLPILKHPPRSVDDVMRAELTASYGDRTSPYLMYNEPSSYHAMVDRAALLSAAVVRRSRHVIVNSTTAQRMVEMDLGPGETLPPCTVIPLAATDGYHLLLQPGVQPETSPPLLVTLGIVDDKKRPAAVIEAASMMREPARVAFVGPCGDELRAHLLRVAARFGMTDRVEFTGHVTFDVYGQWLQRASCAVMLRTINFGESSGAVHDAIAAGLPTITSVSACRDLPPDVVEMVPADIGVVPLAEAIQALLGDPVRLGRMRAACLAYAEQWGYRQVAAALTSVLGAVVERAPIASMRHDGS